MLTILIIFTSLVCANYQPPSPETLILWGLQIAASRALERSEVYPGQAGPVVTSLDPRSFQYGSFGLVPHWAKPDLARCTYNARSETVASKPSYRSAWRQGQLAVIPVMGFYEPNYETGKPVRWRISRADGRMFGLAGIWERRLDDPGICAWSFSMLTINATDHPLMSRFHAPEDEKRSVVVLDDDTWDDWLNARSDADRRVLLQPMDPDAMTAEPAPKVARSKS